jgi:hypothetical protein
MANAVAVEPRGVAPVPFTIRNGQSISEPQDVGGWDPVALDFVQPWTTASITFLAAEQRDGSYSPVYGPTGTEAAVTTGTGARTIMLAANTLADLRGLRYLKLRSGTEAAPVTQTGDRVILMLVRQGA